jgi:hypothetical protein
MVGRVLCSGYAWKCLANDPALGNPRLQDGQLFSLGDETGCLPFNRRDQAAFMLQNSNGDTHTQTALSCSFRRSVIGTCV